ncbi:MAG: MFS transporter, partial [Chloroflexota bacterium]
LPLAALLTLGATPSQMGWLAAMGAAPTLVFGLLAGAWVDRLRRRPIMIVADIGRALVLFSLPLAAALGVLRLEQLFVVTALAGTLTVFFDVAYRSYLPSLVEREQIVEGNSKLALSDSTAEVLGPGVAGVLVQTLTAPIAIFFDALSFLVSAVSVWLIRKPEPLLRQAQDGRVVARQHVVREIGEGLRVVASHPLLRAPALANGVSSFFGNFYAGLYGLYAIRELGLGPALLGFTVAMGGVGSLVGALVAARVVRRLGVGGTFITMLLAMGVTGLLIPLANGPVWLATTFMSLAQLGDAFRTIYSINDTSLRQSITPDRLLGRVNASVQLLVAGVGPIGAIVGGVLAEVIGVRQTLFIAALGPFLACAWLALSPVRGLKEQPSA